MRPHVLVLILTMSLLVACSSLSTFNSEPIPSTNASTSTAHTPAGQRGLTLSDFQFLEQGMSLEEIVDRVGEPDRELGSGISHFQYDLTDGRTLELVFLHLDDLLGAVILEEDGNVIDLLEKQG